MEKEIGKLFYDCKTEIMELLGFDSICKAEDFDSAFENFKVELHKSINNIIARVETANKEYNKTSYFIVCLKDLVKYLRDNYPINDKWLGDARYDCGDMSLHDSKFDHIYPVHKNEIIRLRKALNDLIPKNQKKVEENNLPSIIPEQENQKVMLLNELGIFEYNVSIKK